MVLAAHHQADERHVRHHHYLTGSLRCNRCGSRLSFTVAKRRYQYFYCRDARRNPGCPMPHLPVRPVERLVEQRYAHLRLTAAQRGRLAAAVGSLLETEANEASEECRRQEHREARARSDQQRVLEAFYQYALPGEVLQREERRIEKELAQSRRLIADARRHLGAVNAKRDHALHTVETLDVARLYKSGRPPVRRLMNQALFDKIRIDDLLADQRVPNGYGRDRRLVATSLRTNNPDYDKLAQAILMVVLAESDQS